MNDIVREAVRLHRQGHWRQAERRYEKVLERDPEQPDALHFLGVLRHQRGDSDAAIELIERALEVSPEYPDAHKNLGNVLLESGDAPRAEACYRQALELHPDDAEAHNNLGIALKAQDRMGEAIEAGFRATELDPRTATHWSNFANTLDRAGLYEQSVSAFHKAIARDRQLAAAHTGLCRVLYRIERKQGLSPAVREERVAAYRQWLETEPDNPVAAFMLAACSGDGSLERAPDDFIRRLFDDTASGFDANLSVLDYRVPDLIRKRLEALLGAPAANLAVLDGGCGTGLCGEALRPWAARLEGVDLSAGMLDRARRRGPYDELAEAELTAFLETRHAAFDLVACADTLCYFGSLSRVLRASAQALKPGGWLLFTVERLPEAEGKPGYALQTSGRYGHTPEYLRECLVDAGFHAVGITTDILRKEGGEPVAGLLAEARAADGSQS